MSAALSPTTTSPGHALGVACGVLAGALWGLVFLAPALVRAFTPLQLTAGRYLGYGLLSVALLAPRWRRLKAHVGRREWRTLSLLALTGNTLYYLLLSTAVQTVGIAMTSLILGFLPVAVTFLGSRDEGAVPLRALWPSLVCCVAGALCIGFQALTTRGSMDVAAQLLGMAAALGALVSWTAFAVGNSRQLRRLSAVSVQDWNLLTGVVTGAQGLVLVPFAMWLDVEPHTRAAWLQLAGVSLGVAVLASVIGNGFWNKMSRLLPLTLVGQMILFETLFALLYGFAWERRWPTSLEAAAFVLVSASVVSCLRAHRGPRVACAAAVC